MTKKRKVLLGITGLLIIICLAMATLALWTKNFTQTSTNKMAINCVKIEFMDFSNTVINAQYSYPISDEEGLNTDPYVVEIVNKCPYAVSYDVILNELKENTLSPSYAKIAVNDSYGLLVNFPETDTISSLEDEMDRSWIVSGGIIGANSTRTLETRAWITESATTSQALNKHLAFEMAIDVTIGVNGNYLASKILASNTLFESSPDFTAAPTDETSGLYQMEDDKGMSYYFRGIIDSNYVSFAGKLWRIVRINGDGSTRLIAEDSVSDSPFNTTNNNHKYVGYTYDNSHNCTNANPCNGSEGTASTIKTYLDNWYNTNLKSYEDKIVTGDYCNDTSYRLSGSTRYYGAYDRRISSATHPVLTCPDTSVNYGGKYKLKLGLLTADEMVLAGYTRSSSTTNSYLEKSSWWWSFSPSYSDTNYAFVFSASSTFHYSGTSSSGGVRPVINLKADTKVTAGDGSASNPYIIK